MQPIPTNYSRDRGCITCKHLSREPLPPEKNIGNDRHVTHLCEWLGPLPEWVLMHFIDPTSNKSGHRERHIPKDRVIPPEQVRWSGDRCLTYERDLSAYIPEEKDD